MTELPKEPVHIEVRLAMGDDTDLSKLEYLADPFLPRRHVVGFFGKGECGKSSLLATLAALVSNLEASTLWISTEEREDFIRKRHTETGTPMDDGTGAEIGSFSTEHMNMVRGRKGSLSVVVGDPTKWGKDGHPIASNFNVYEHLEPAIASAQAKFAASDVSPPPLRFVVLDTIVALTTWTKQESPNDDASVKKLIKFLEGVAEKHDLTIAMVGHANKGKHDDFSDSVMGARAWIDGPRLSFVHTKDLREDYSFVIRAAKNNLGPKFAMAFKTFPVHILHERAWAPGGNSVLCKTTFTPLVWGETACAALWHTASTKERMGDGKTAGPQHLTIADQLVNCIVTNVLESEQPLNRDHIHRHFGREVRRDIWTKADETLMAKPGLYRVRIERGDKNAVWYRKWVN